MPNFFNKYPYTDFHELNLDWILETVKNAVAEWLQTKTEWNATKEEWTELYNYVHDYFDNLDVQDEVDNKINEMISDGTFVQLVGDLFYYKTPQMYGAVGDGIADDTAALQQCINENSKTVIPAGIYLISDTIDIPEHHTIEMAGHLKTLLTMYPFDNQDTSDYAVIRSETNVPMFQIHKGCRIIGGIIYAHGTNKAIYCDIGTEMISNLKLDTAIVGVGDVNSIAVHFDGTTGTTGYLTISDLECAIAHFDKGYYLDRPTGAFPWITALTFRGNLFNNRKGITHSFTNNTYAASGSIYECMVCGGYTASTDAVLDICGDSNYINVVVSDIGSGHNQKYAMDLSRLTGSNILVNDLFRDYIKSPINPGTIISDTTIQTITDANGTIKCAMAGKMITLNVNGTYPTGLTQYTLDKVTFNPTTSGDFTVSTGLFIRVSGNDSIIRVGNTTGAPAAISNFSLSLLNV